MGCDIHLYVETLKTVNGKVTWVNCDNWQINPYYGDEGEHQYEINPLYSNRNYNIFAILANVRNYHENEPIVTDRGLPCDIHKATKQESDRWDSDGHSHSWLTLKEIKDYFKSHPVVKYSGKMTPEDAAMVDAGEMPEMWCEDTTIKTYVYREWEHENEPLKEFIEKIEAKKRDEFRIYNKEERPEVDAKIRIVFWFDN